MTGNNLKLGRDAHLFAALMTTGDPRESYTSLLSWDHCLNGQSAKGYTDSSKDYKAMGMIIMQPV